MGKKKLVKKKVDPLDELVMSYATLRLCMGLFLNKNPKDIKEAATGVLVCLRQRLREAGRNDLAKQVKPKMGIWE